LSHFAVRFANRMLGPLGLSLLPNWRHQVPTFEFHGRTVSCFCHTYNCGYPPGRMTERAVELALADLWLSRRSPTDVTEIGAVTPYYWPGRVVDIVDPFDPHAAVTDRRSLFARGFAGWDVLSISTLEHIGFEDYGPSEKHETVAGALAKLFSEPRSILVTLPFGFNPKADEALINATVPKDGRRTFLVRSPDDNDWREAAWPSAGTVRYGGASLDSRWANGLAVFERGLLL
jgi:hypothetical protein